METQNPERTLTRSQLICQRRRTDLIEQYEREYLPGCHKSMNKEFTETGRSFMIKDNRIQLRHPSLHATTLFKTSFPILQHSDHSYKNIDQTKALWKTAMLTYKRTGDMGKGKNATSSLANSHQPVANVSISNISKGHIRGSHSRGTNPGYSRNKTGGFYTR